MSKADEAADPEIAALLAGFDALSVEQRRVAAAALTLPPSRFTERNRLVVECLQRFYGDRPSIRDAAKDMAAALNRYRATSWSRDRAAAECPMRISTAPHGAFWSILKQVERSLSHDRIEEIVRQFEVPRDGA